jgi:hypothetical protein
MKFIFCASCSETERFCKGEGCAKPHSQVSLDNLYPEIMRILYKVKYQCPYCAQFREAKESKDNQGQSAFFKDGEYNPVSQLLENQIDSSSIQKINASSKNTKKLSALSQILQKEREEVFFTPMELFDHLINECDVFYHLIKKDRVSAFN